METDIIEIQVGYSLSLNIDGIYLVTELCAWLQMDLFCGFSNTRVFNIYFGVTWKAILSNFKNLLKT